MQPVNALGNPVEGDPMLHSLLYLAQHYLDSRYTDTDSRKIVFSYKHPAQQQVLTILAKERLARPISPLSILFEGITNVEDVAHYGQPYQLLAWFN